MMCSSCRAKEDVVPETWWEQLRYWFFERFFVEEIKSVTTDAHVKSFADGYKMGFQHAAERTKDSNSFFQEYVKKLEDLVVKKAGL